MKKYLLALMLVLGLSAHATERPNILFIIIDDLGYKDLSCYGSKFYETPAIDSLAKEGMQFTSAYVAAPRCVASRTSITTGKYHYRFKGEGGVALAETTIAEALKENGYKTFFAGKWHLGHGVPNRPDKQGFDINIGGGGWGSPPSYFAPYHIPRGKDGHAEDDGPLPGLEDAPKDEYITDRLTDETIKFLENHAKNNSKQPFFAELAHYAVHTPFQAKPELLKKYQDKLASMTREEGAPFQRDFTGSVKQFQDHAVYAAMIESADQSIGRIMATLKRLNMDKNTIIVLTSDNGGLSTTAHYSNRDVATSNLPLRTGKGWLYEGGIRVPLLVRWPGVTKAASQTEQMINGTDYYATFLEMAGAPPKPEQALDSISFVPVLKGNKAFQHPPIIWYYMFAKVGTGNPSMAAIRDGDFKLVYFPVEDRSELYNIKNDVGEKHDLSASMPEKVQTMKASILAWRDKLNIAPLTPKDNHYRTTNNLMKDGPSGKKGGKKDKDENPENHSKKATKKKNAGDTHQEDAAPEDE